MCVCVYIYIYMFIYVYSIKLVEFSSESCVSSSEKPKT